MHILQSTLFPPAGLPEALYLRIHNPVRNRAVAPRTGHGDALCVDLDPGDVLSTDTFFGAFYRAHWRAWTPVREVAVAVEFRGRGKVRVFEDIGQGARLLSEVDLDAATRRGFLIEIRLASLDPTLFGGAAASRLFVEVEAIRGAEVYGIDFVSPTAPRRAATLSVAIRSAGPDTVFARTLADLARLAQETQAIRSVEVVDAEGICATGALAALLSGSPKLRLASAGDLAGTLAAAATGQEAAHHLLMDGDILLDPRMVQRLLRFLDYAAPEVAIGAGMLDSLRPTVMHEAGATLRSDRIIEPWCRDVDLADPGQLWHFNSPAETDHNGWWFCALPLAPLRGGVTQTGRGAAVDHARALAQAGVPVLTLPGIGVWQQAFRARPELEVGPEVGPDFGPSSGPDAEVPAGTATTPGGPARMVPASDPESGGRAGAAAPARVWRDLNDRRLHVLQQTLFPTPELPEGLYLRLRNPHRPRRLDPPRLRGGLTLEPGDILSTDTFFGAFYRSYWHSHTAVRDLAVVAGIRGRVRLRVFEDTGRGVTLICDQALEAPTLRHFALDLHPTPLETTPFSETATSRLFAEIEAERPSEVHGLDFATPQAPLRRATLSIGLCTFNQEAYFARTLAAVTALAEATPAIRTIHVVNQGAEFAAPAIRALLDHPRVQAVRQGNFGGCGGFTRTLDAALRAGAPTTHHLMMDDDIVLDARMIPRALRFLDHARDDIALGAGMLDSLRPTVMYEAGAFLRPDNTIAPHCHNIDLADPGQQGHFNTPVQTDYNAWWFCILPLERCRAVGLPAPVFIRGDDFEYGQRLARAGVATVTLPGIAVWHEPFYAKAQGWQSYYDLRNRLIFAATYPERVRQLSLAHVTGLIATAILTHSYAIAELRLRAVADFLLGPEALFAQDPEALHAEIMALNRASPPEKLDERAWKQRPAAPAKPRRDSMRALIRDYAASMLRTGFGPLDRRGEAVLLDVDAHPRNTAGRAYVLTNGPRSFHLRFVPGRGRMWRLMARAAATAWHYRQRRAAVGRAWAGGIAPYRSPDWWAALFGPAADRRPAPGGPQTPPPPGAAVACGAIGATSSDRPAHAQDRDGPAPQVAGTAP